MSRYVVLMVSGGLLMLAGIGMTAYTLVVTPEEGVNIGGGYIAVLGLFLLALGGALRGEQRH